MDTKNALICPVSDSKARIPETSLTLLRAKSSRSGDGTGGKLGLKGSMRGEINANLCQITRKTPSIDLQEHDTQLPLFVFD